MHIDQLLETGLVPIGTAAETLGIEPKRLLGYCFRNKLADPISDGQEVYGWSCKTLALRLADAKVADSRTSIKPGVTP